MQLGNYRMYLLFPTTISEMKWNAGIKLTDDDNKVA